MLSCVRRKINCDSRVQDIHTFHSISRVFARKRRKKFLRYVSPQKRNHMTLYGLTIIIEVVHIQHHRLIGN